MGKTEIKYENIIFVADDNGISMMTRDYAELEFIKNWEVASFLDDMKKLVDGVAYVE